MTSRFWPVSGVGARVGSTQDAACQALSGRVSAQAVSLREPPGPAAVQPAVPPSRTSDPEHAPPPIDSVDEELAALPAPRAAAPAVDGLVVAACLVAAWACSCTCGRRRLQLRRRARVRLGAVTAVDLAELETNRYVRVRGTPMLSRMVRSERALSGQRYACFRSRGSVRSSSGGARRAHGPSRAAQGESAAGC